MMNRVEEVLESILVTLEANREHLPPLLPGLVAHWRKQLDEVHDELWPALTAQRSDRE